MDSELCLKAAEKIGNPNLLINLVSRRKERVEGGEPITEVRGQEAEVRGQKAEVRGLITDIGKRRSADRRQRKEVEKVRR